MMVPFILNPNFQGMWSRQVLAMLIAVAVVPMAGGVLLWFAAGALAARICGDTGTNVGIKDDDLVRAGTFVVGAYLLVQHLGILMNRLTSTGDIAFGSMVVLALSVLMTLGTGFIGVLYNKLKYFGSNAR